MHLELHYPKNYTVYKTDYICLIILDVRYDSMNLLLKWSFILHY